MTFRGCFPLFSKITQTFSGSWLLMGKTKLDETYIFKISIKMRFFWCSYWYQNSVFQTFGYYWARLLLTTVRYHELFDETYIVIIILRKINDPLSFWSVLLKLLKSLSKPTRSATKGLKPNLLCKNYRWHQRVWVNFKTGNWH